MVGAITLGHYAAPLSLAPLHDVMRRLYYLPIFLAAGWFGLRGSLTTAMAISLLYLPHIVFQWAPHSAGHGGHDGQLNRYLECLIFLLFGGLFGLVIDRLRGTDRALRQALERLSESFERTRTQHRLAALGELSAGLAHEIRNPLAGIRSSLDLLEHETDDDARRDFLALAQGEIERADKLLGGLLDYARPRRLQLIAVDPADILGSVKQLIDARARDQGVTLETSAATHGPVQLDLDQSTQVLLNLALNALDSLRDNPDDERRDRLRLEARVTPAEEIRFSVSDNGPGVPAEDRERIFDPFVTTRETGTGLGLAISHRIATNHCGTLTLESPIEDGRGARFVLTIPARPPESHRPDS